MSQLWKEIKEQRVSIIMELLGIIVAISLYFDLPKKFIRNFNMPIAQTLSFILLVSIATYLIVIDMEKNRIIAQSKEREKNKDTTIKINEDAIEKLTKQNVQDKIGYEDKIGSNKDKNIQRSFNSILDSIIQEFTSSNISYGWKLYNDHQKEIMEKIDSINNKLKSIRIIYNVMIKRENHDPDIFLNIHQEVYNSFEEINNILQPIKQTHLYDPTVNNFKNVYEAYKLWLVDYNKHIVRAGYKYIYW